MKSLLKVAALLVVAMPLWAADMTTTTTTTTNGAANTVDCSKMMGAEKDKCMKEMKDNCMKMTDAAKKKECMDKMEKTTKGEMSNMNDMGKTAQ